MVRKLGADRGETIIERSAREGYADAAGAIVKLIRNGGMKVVKEIFEKSDAVVARRQGKNVVMETEQAAKQVEKAAFGGGDGMLRHRGHPLPNGEQGKPHFQTEGEVGHTFWGDLSAFGAALLNPFDLISSPLGCPAGEGCYQGAGL